MNRGSRADDPQLAGQQIYPNMQRVVGMPVIYTDAATGLAHVLRLRFTRQDAAGNGAARNRRYFSG